MKFFENLSPSFVLLLFVAFVFLVIWAGRCKRCKKWFAFSLRSRNLLGQGYRERFVNEKGRSVVRRVYEYRYSCEKECVYCGYSYSYTETSSRALSTGNFQIGISHKEPPVGELKWYSPRNLLRISFYIKCVKFLAVLVTIFFVGMPFYNFDVIRYPAHFQSYLEQYAEFFLDPFDSSGYQEKQARLMVEGGSWKKVFVIEEFDGANWNFKSNVTLSGIDTDIGSPKPLNAIEDAGSGEAVVGQQRQKCVSEKFTLVFKETKSGKNYEVNDFVIFLRLSDREHSLKHLNEKFFCYFMNAKDSWKAYVRGAGANSYVDLFVEDSVFNEVRAWSDK